VVLRRIVSAFIALPDTLKTSNKDMEVLPEARLMSR